MTHVRHWWHDLFRVIEREDNLAGFAIEEMEAMF